jgi:hypothetical protein
LLCISHRVWNFLFLIANIVAKKIMIIHVRTKDVLEKICKLART